MEVGSCFQLGYVNKTHGLNGEVKIVMDTDNPENYQNLESVFLKLNEKLVPFFVESIHINRQTAILALEEVLSIENAQELVGSEIYLPLEILPPLKGNKFYYHEIVGFKAVDNHRGEFGIIQDTITHSGNDIFQIINNGVEILVPVQDDILENVDRKNKVITFNLPEGLLDIYL